VAFPPKEFDGINNLSSSDRAAFAFVAMFQKQISVVRPVMSSQQNNTGGENNSEHYTEPLCPFRSGGCNQILSDITNRPLNSRPLLLLYLHPPLHPDGTKFMREYLCHAELLQLLNSNNSDSHGSVVCFGASIHTADGQRMRDMLGVTSFPFMALLSIKSSGLSSSNTNNVNSTMELMLRLEGPQLLKIPPSQVLTYLNTTITRHAEILAMEESRRLQREEDQRLREEQNREYQETLLEDQMREAERQEAVERERRAQEEEEEAVRLERVKEENRLEDAKAMMKTTGGEPPAGSKNVARLRFALPNGKKIEQRFHVADTIGVLRAFLILHFHEQQDIEIKNFGLSTNFPRKTFGEEDDKVTLEQSGLAPQSVIMVQDLDA